MNAISDRTETTAYPLEVGGPGELLMPSLRVFEYAVGGEAFARPPEVEPEPAPVAPSVVSYRPVDSLTELASYEADYKGGAYVADGDVITDEDGMDDRPTGNGVGTAQLPASHSNTDPAVSTVAVAQAALRVQMGTLPRFDGRATVVAGSGTAELPRAQAFAGAGFDPIAEGFAFVTTAPTSIFVG